MRNKKKTQKREKSAMSVSLYGNLFFVIVELGMAIYTGSQAVLLDSVYDGIEFCMLLPSIFLIPLLYKPANEEHPYGYLQVETIFLVIKGVTMTSVTIGLIANNIHIILNGGRSVSFGTVAYFEVFAAVLGVIVYFYLKRKNKMLHSPLIHVEMLGWGLDSVLSLGMAVAFFLPMLIPFDWFRNLVPYLDPMITVILSLIMIPGPIKTVITSFRDLMLIPPENETVEEIKEIVDPYLAGCHGVDFYYEIVRTGRRIWISAYVVFEKDTVSLSKMKEVQTNCIKALKEKYDNFYFELIPEFHEPKQDAAPDSQKTEREQQAEKILTDIV